METIVQTPVFTFPFLGTLTGVLFWWQCSSLEAGDKDYTKGYVSFKRLCCMPVETGPASVCLITEGHSVEVSSTGQSKG